MTDDNSGIESDKVTLLEALASEIVPTGVNRSNMSTPTAGDADDQ